MRYREAMITQTTLNGIQVMLSAAVGAAKEPGCRLNLNRLADELQCSPTYLKKVANLLVRADLLSSRRGVRGGVFLARPPESIVLREVVECCQGMLTADYCSSKPTEHIRVCGFHQAMSELHTAMLGVLDRWTLADLQRCPVGLNGVLPLTTCRMTGGER